MKKRQSKMRFTTRGKTPMERWYMFARHFCAIIAYRQKHNPRCKRCFAMCARGDRLPVQGVRFGCDGCAEMETFMFKCREFFAAETGRNHG